MDTSQYFRLKHAVLEVRTYVAGLKVLTDYRKPSSKEVKSHYFV